jgi:hypothetical protein
MIIGPENGCVAATGQRGVKAAFYRWRAAR